MFFLFGEGTSVYTIICFYSFFIRVFVFGSNIYFHNDTNFYFHLFLEILGQFSLLNFSFFYYHIREATKKLFFSLIFLGYLINYLVRQKKCEILNLHNWQNLIDKFVKITLFRFICKMCVLYILFFAKPFYKGKFP